MTREEMLPKFQELSPACFFCKTKHGGEGYSDQRMDDVIAGIEPPDVAYICQECQPRRPEFNKIMKSRRQRFELCESLRERKLFDFDVKYRLSAVGSDLREGNPELFQAIDQYPLASNLWIFGKCGIGKSHVSRSIGNRYVYDLKTCASITGPQFRTVGEEFGQKRESLLDLYSQVELLIIDDIDKALKWTESSLEVMWSVSDARERTGRRTIVTSQVTPQDFFKGVERMIPGSAEFSVSILDRLKPLSVFEFHGQPRRGL